MTRAGPAARALTLALASSVFASGASVRRAPRVAALAHSTRALAAAPRPDSIADSLLWMEMRNVDLHIDEQQVMHMRSLRGQVVARAPGAVAWLDDPTSFHVRATSGLVSLDGDAVAALLNEVTFHYPHAPISHLRVRIESGALVQRGILHKGVDIPFEMWSRPVLESSGRLRLHPDRLRIFSVNGIALMRALGLHLSKLMDLRGARGASVSGDDLLIDPLQLIPPPLVEGRVAAVRIEGPQLVLELARTADDTIFGTYVRPDSSAHNFVYFRGGRLRFGKLTMSDTDLLIGDDDERDPLDLSLAQYNRQLVAGRTKNLANLGLRTWMIDYHRLAPAHGDRG